jgi:hypothetical protein
LKIFFKLISLAALLIIPVASQARDINLDEIYIKKTSPVLKKLAIEKLETYRKVEAVFVDSNVIFALWIGGNDIIYIKENDQSITNHVFKYRLMDRKYVELCKVSGVITIAKVTQSGRYLILKRLMQGKGLIPQGETVIVNLESGQLKTISSSYAFLDFTVPSEGSSILLEKGKGIVELALDTNLEKELLAKKNYNDIIISPSPSLCYLSPDRQKYLLLNGSGGNYNARLLGRAGSVNINGISSSSEVFWLDNFTLIYRTGFAGNFSVILHNTVNNRIITLLRNSYNTNINFSWNSGIIAFLKEQLIFYYNKSEDKIKETGLEGEDISFAPNARFVSLMFKKLFLVNSGLLERKHIELKRSWNIILNLYKDLYTRKEDFENEHSRFYIERKMQLYEKLCD